MFLDCVPLFEVQCHMFVLVKFGSLNDHHFRLLVWLVSSCAAGIFDRPVEVAAVGMELCEGVCTHNTGWNEP